MKKLLIILLFLPFLSLAQTPDSTAYKKKKLSLEEINFVNGYYTQTGQNAAVDGGSGDESLTDISNVFSVKLKKVDKKEREHTYGIKIGLDYYTSASSDRIDPSTISSASSEDVRVYPTFTWGMYNEKKRTEYGANFAFSAEYDYVSTGLGLSFGGHSKDKNTNWIMRGQAYFDQWSLIYPIEVRGKEELPRSDRSSYSANFVVSQVLTKRLQVALMADVIYQNGLLSTPFHRFYFVNTTLARLERLPESRIKTPVGLRLNYFLGDRIIIKSWARYYQDDWNLTAFTAQIETPVKVNSFLSVYPFYRFYQQNAIDYFYTKNTLAQNTAEFYTSDFDLSTFKSKFYGVGLRYSPPTGIVSSKALKFKWSTLGLRYGHYDRDNGLTSDIVSIHLKLTPTE